MFSSIFRSKPARKSPKHRSRLNVEALEARDVPSFTDGFETTTLDPYWTEVEKSGYITVPSNEWVHNGSQSVKFSSTNSSITKDVRLTHNFSTPQYGKASVWFFDTGADVYSSNSLALVLTNLATGQVAYTGVPDYDLGAGNNGSTYSATIGDVNYPSSIDRTAAWHKWTIDATPSGTTVSIDNQTLISGSVGVAYDRIDLLMLAPSWRPAWTSYWDDFEFVEYANPDPQPDIQATSLSSNTSQGGVDFTYAVTGADLPQATTARLYWSADDKFDSGDALAYTAQVGPAQGSYGPFNVPDSVLVARPVGATHLLLAVDPSNDVAESDESNNVVALEVQNLAPIPSIDSISEPRLEGTAIVVQGSAVDPDGDSATISYTWSVYKYGALDLAFTGTGADWTFTPSDEGSYQVVLTATDAEGASASASQTITVANVPAQLDPVKGPAGPVAAGSPSPVTVAGSFSDAGSADTHLATWTWGDGSTSQGLVTEASGLGTVTGSHTYAVAGVYSITLSVMDSTGGIAQITSGTVVVYDPTGVVYIAKPTSTASMLVAKSSQKPLSLAVLRPLVAEAKRRWNLTGLTLAERKLLRQARFQIADLDGATLGLAIGNTITIDRNAAGQEWFVDRSRRNDSEFNLPGNQGEQGHMDLLTAAMHEIGQILGRQYADSGVMSGVLEAGIRLAPKRGQ